MRYYIDQTSWYSYPARDIPKLAAVVKAAGGSNVRASNNYGWSNQPKVVTFSVTPAQVSKIKAALERKIPEYRKWGVQIRKKHW